jgi:hypothetical protein
VLGGIIFSSVRNQSMSRANSVAYASLPKRTSQTSNDFSAFQEPGTRQLLEAAQN